MYTIKVMGEHRMQKFNTTSTLYNVTFKDLDIRGIPNILKSLKVLFDSIIKNITEFMDPSDLVRLCGKEEIKTFQRVLDGYQIHVVSKEHCNAIIYGGPAPEKKIYLYLHDHHYDVITTMQVIVTGSKLLSIDVPNCNIRFIDSINFLPMALDRFPKTFCLKEMVKGVFPHLFNTQENQHTNLPNLPDLKFYNPDGMTRDKRSTFMQWYEEYKNDPFNLQEELLKCCRSDVDILRKGCLEFRKMMMDITTKGDLDGIAPFESCITIASAYNLVLAESFWSIKVSVLYHLMDTDVNISSPSKL
ncbi:unnamed protein product [Mytilus coruscus]|uniref:DNA-directed DNA polymerase n=1 Tax=Mytilus coruscus TaxID=42192 RepID=A0A6J8C895_MYTCO|nr:unnamed protein product [Mytilus coruscus]